MESMKRATFTSGSRRPTPGVKTVTRRQALGALGATLSLVNCSSSPTAADATTTTTTGTTNATCAAAPTETLGPYPSIANFIRSDIREGKTGVPVTLTITVVNANSNCAPVSGAVVDIWQCDAEGHYSEYAQQGYNGTSETFLRGIQTTDPSGNVTFTTVYPGWYAGRATHIHVEVTANGKAVKVTQIAFPESVTAAVYASSVYASKGQNPTSNSSDMVFADSLSSETATISGSPSSGYTATFTVGVSV
jgi:protocatechuate 3,4-dioxygenase beta subunit